MGGKGRRAKERKERKGGRAEGRKGRRAEGRKGGRAEGRKGGRAEGRKGGSHKRGSREKGMGRQWCVHSVENPGDLRHQCKYKSE